jgi:hypothetical protein
MHWKATTGVFFTPVIMSDFDPADTIVSADQLAQALELTPARILALTRLGILRPVYVSRIGETSDPRYEFLESLRAYLRHLRASVHKEN